MFGVSLLEVSGLWFRGLGYGFGFRGFPFGFWGFRVRGFGGSGFPDQVFGVLEVRGCRGFEVRYFKVSGSDFRGSCFGLSEVRGF